MRWTYEELDQRVDECASSLIEIGLSIGDRVGIYSPNNAEWMLLQMACARANLILVNVNPAFQASELKYCIQKVGMKALVTAESFKSSNYIEIINTVVPELSSSGSQLYSTELPDLKHVISLSSNKHEGMMRW
jgi:fatty-acyl-CoA synthase